MYKRQGDIVTGDILAGDRGSTGATPSAGREGCGTGTSSLCTGIAGIFSDIAVDLEQACRAFCLDAEERTIHRVGRAITNG